MRRFNRDCEWFAAALAVGLCACSAAARAQDATWTPPTSSSNNFEVAANWTPAAVPTGTAFFGPALTTGIGISSAITIGGFTFNAGAPAYSFGLFQATPASLTFTGAGIVNNSSNIPFIGPAGFGPTITFRNASSAGNARYIANLGTIGFFETSTAGGASFDVGQTGVSFNNSSNAGSASFTLERGATIQFNDNSSAQNATFTTNTIFFPSLLFTGGSTAANATFNLVGGGVRLAFSGNSTAANAAITLDGTPLSFSGFSTAGNAAITTNAGLFFGDNSTAGSATITLNNSATARFLGGSSGGNARFTVNPGSVFDISGLTVAGMTAGSIEGSGSFFLGSKQLTIGSNNLVTEVSGVIADGGASGGSGGALVKTGAGTLTLSGNNTYTGGTTISGGALQLGHGGSSGAILGNVVDNAVLAFNRSDSYTFDGVISGTGSVQQVGTGKTILTATSTYTGTTLVFGSLAVNGSIASSSGLTVNLGGTVGGTGTLPTTLINNGSLAPGNSIGTISISGNLTFVGAGNYLVEVSGASSDKSLVSGTAALGGKVLVTPLSTPTAKTTYTILSAANVNGTFGSVALTNNFARNPVLSYGGGNVLLTLDPGLLSPLLPNPATANQRGVAGAIDNRILAGIPLTAGFDALFALTPAGLSGALDQLSGEVHASTAGLLADESLYMRSAILGRLRQASYGGDMGAMAALRLGGPQAFAGDEELSALAYAKSPIVTKAPVRPPQASSDTVFWGQGFGAWGRFDGDGNATSVRRDLAGFITGVDMRVGANGRAGLAAGYTSSRNTLDARGSANVETGHVAAYGGWSLGALNLRGGAAYAFHTIDTDRLIAFPGFFDRATAHYDGGTGQVFGEAGYGFAFGNVAVEPFAGGAWVRVQTDSAAERATLAGLNFAGTTFETSYSTLGIRAGSLFALDNGMVLIPRGSLAWQHAFDSVTPAAVLAFQTAPAIPFAISGVPIARDAALAEAGLDLALNSHATIGVSYTGQIANNVQDHAAKGRFSWRF